VYGAGKDGIEEKDLEHRADLAEKHIRELAYHAGLFEAWRNRQIRITVHSDGEIYYSMRSATDIRAKPRHGTRR
jgi:hypothetical protein